MILVILSGRNPTMRHLGRVHGVSVKWLNNRLGEHAGRDNVYLFYQDTKWMSADIYTKAFIVKENWIYACKLISCLLPDDVSVEKIAATEEGGRELMDALATFCATKGLDMCVSI